VFKFPQVEVCSIADSILSVNNENIHNFTVPMFGIYNQSFIRDRIVEAKETFNRRFPGRLHQCPLQRDDFKLYNISSYIKNDFEKILPDGDYRYEHKFWNDDDENIFTVTVYEAFKTGEPAFF
jgi:hypothetical protein